MYFLIFNILKENIPGFSFIGIHPGMGTNVVQAGNIFSEIVLM